MSETFFKTLKVELIWRHAWQTRQQLTDAHFNHINGFYKIRRRHSTLRGLSPTQFEQILPNREEKAEINWDKSSQPRHAFLPYQTGKLQQNAYVERYNCTVRNEWLDQYIIRSMEGAQEFAPQWLWTYNNERPNTGIGGVTPAQKLKMAA